MLRASPAGASVYAATGSAHSIASGRLSYELGLHGPCVSYDTSCSAALAACHGGLHALQLGECTQSFVAAVHLMLLPGTAMSFAMAGMTSQSGRSHTFDARADGYARGEGCGGIILHASQLVYHNLELLLLLLLQTMAPSAHHRTGTCESGSVRCA